MVSPCRTIPMTLVLAGGLVTTPVPRLMAQGPTERFGQLEFAVMKGTREPREDRLVITDSSEKSLCRYGILAPAPAAADPRSDFRAAWEAVRALYPHATEPPSPAVDAPAAGVQHATALRGVKFADGSKADITVHTFTVAGSRRSAFTYYTSLLRCAVRVGTFEQSLRPVGVGTTVASTPAPAPPTPSAQTPPPSTRPSNGTATPPAAPRTPPSAPAGAGGPTGTTGWAYMSTSFSDGWQSVAKEDWVEGTRGAVTVRLHHPGRADAEYYSQMADEVQQAWNRLVAPHFRDITDLAVEREQMGGFEPVGYASASAVDPATGNRVHVVLSKRRGRGTRWIEIVTPDVATYDREIGPYRQGNTDWNRILALHGLNRFAIAASDLGGTWSDNYASATSMVFVNTGWSAGTMYTGGSSELRVNGGSYQLAVTIAQGIAPAIQWRRETFAGAITVPDPWHLRLTGGFQGRTDVFDASFEAVKGGRILNLSTAANGSPIAYHFIRVN